MSEAPTMLGARDALIGHDYAVDEAQVVELLQSGGEALSAPLCIHHYWQHTDLPLEWTVHHTNPVCWRNQQKNLDLCVAFCGPSGHIEQTVTRHPGGYLHACPFGCDKIAVPIVTEGVTVGTLFAGPFRRGKGARLPPTQAVCLVSAIALKLGRLLHGEDAPPDSRKSTVLSFLATHCEEPVGPHDLARALSLSPSRSSHVVRELLGHTFSQLLRNTRLSAAARCLRDTDMNCAEIALRFHFYDQSHFSRCFKERFRQSPLKYRARYGTG